MTFLQLVNALKVACSVSGAGITTVVSQSGEALRLVTWIQDAYEDIQNENFDWLFLKADSSFTTAINTNIIPVPSGLNVWDVERIYDSSGNNVEMIEYAAHKEFIDVTNTGTPSLFVIKPDNTLIAIPYPDDTLTYTFDYFIDPDTLDIDADEPLIPAQFQRIIIARAMIYYGNFESASEFKVQGTEMYQAIMERMLAHQTAHKQSYYGRSESVPLQVVAQ